MFQVKYFVRELNLEGDLFIKSGFQLRPSLREDLRAPRMTEAALDPQRCYEMESRWFESPPGGLM